MNSLLFASILFSILYSHFYSINITSPFSLFLHSFPITLLRLSSFLFSFHFSFPFYLFFLLNFSFLLFSVGFFILEKKKSYLFHSLFSYSLFYYYYYLSSPNFSHLFWECLPIYFLCRSVIIDLP